MLPLFDITLPSSKAGINNNESPIQDIGTEKTS